MEEKFKFKLQEKHKVLAIGMQIVEDKKNEEI